MQSIAELCDDLATALEGYSEDNLNAELLEVAEKGLLVAYELLEDNEMALEVAIGDPLTDQDQADLGPCLPVQWAYLNLSSGNLGTEGYGNCRLSPDFDPDEEPGALLNVPSGEYIVSIYSIDGDVQA